ncbi:MAG: sugar phosphate isomerase/epimerase [Armatimonadota bacterium]
MDLSPLKPRLRGGIGIQIIIFGEDLTADLASVVSSVRSAGYDYIEASLNIRRIPPAAVLSALAAEGVPIRAVHVGFVDVATLRDLNEMLSFVTDIEASALICSGVLNRSRFGIEESARHFNAVGGVCADKGLNFYYHTHEWEFERDGVSRVRVVDLLLSRTEPELVRFNIDLFWAGVAHMDPVEVIKQLGERCDYYHVKDGMFGSGREDCTFSCLGDGEVKVAECLQQILAAERAVGIVVEQDRPAAGSSANADIVKSRQYLRNLGL